MVNFSKHGLAWLTSTSSALINSDTTSMWVFDEQARRQSSCLVIAKNLARQATGHRHFASLPDSKPWILSPGISMGLSGLSLLLERLLKYLGITPARFALTGQ
jgi:hypothetical protein